MLIKKTIVLWMVFCLLLTGCAASQKGNGENEIPSDIAACMIVLPEGYVIPENVFET